MASIRVVSALRASCPVPLGRHGKRPVSEENRPAPPLPAHVQLLLHRFKIALDNGVAGSAVPSQTSFATTPGTASCQRHHVDRHSLLQHLDRKLRLALGTETCAAQTASLAALAVARTIDADSKEGFHGRVRQTVRKANRVKAGTGSLNSSTSSAAAHYALSLFPAPSTAPVCMALAEADRNKPRCAPAGIRRCRRTAVPLSALTTSGLRLNRPIGCLLPDTARAAVHAAD